MSSCSYSAVELFTNLLRNCIFVCPGANGMPGSPGERGHTGQDGAPGITGPMGPTPDFCVMGSQGEDGRPGPLGQPGAPGAPGMKGERGLNGQDGAPGCEGPKGEKGKQRLILKYYNNTITTPYPWIYGRKYMDGWMDDASQANEKSCCAYKIPIAHELYHGTRTCLFNPHSGNHSGPPQYHNGRNYGRTQTSFVSP
uniref:Uncharacterized protein n=1 Tax=Mola mola TaxID=94237 RepID=A0A3Q3WSN1_MOLML